MRGDGLGERHSKQVDNDEQQDEGPHQRLYRGGEMVHKRPEGPEEPDDAQHADTPEEPG